MAPRTTQSRPSFNIIINLEINLTMMRCLVLLSMVVACNAFQSGWVSPRQVQARPMSDLTPRMLFGGGAKKEGGGGGGPGGMGMGNMMEQFKKVQEIQKKTKELQEAMAVARIDGASASGAVKVVMSGEQIPIEVDISKELMDEGAEKVSAEVTEAVKDATTKSSTFAQGKLAEIYEGLDIPGMGGLPGM
mmetsp:Transcript_29270/g.78587  ORF Transcript_29270/g.78587 Transcript_29270/m.78587 type:complete len:190 (+) Transcript_29270:27-596(+)